MCGITGWLSPDRDLRDHHDILDRMNLTMACRGPDASGTWVDGPVALGHRRLAVLDLEGGAQPMVRVRPDGSRIVITYSGEAYNYRELRTVLAGEGYEFVTSSDTEVVLAAYERWGAQALDRLVGIFAFAIWDSASEELLLARDRLGVKPLHYAVVGGEVIFGSEPKALLAHPATSAQVDEDGLVALFALFGVHLPGRTPLRGIQEVPAGSYAVVDRAGHVRLRPYWQLRVREHTDSPEDTTARVRDLLGAAVDEQLVSDVPLCSLLSGGLDSALVSALAQSTYRAAGSNLATFTVSFAGLAEHFVADADRPDLDEPYARRMAEVLGTDHRTVVVPVQDMLELQTRATLAKDLPAMGDLDSSLLSLFGAVRDRFTVALSGESADEVFGGYAWFHDRGAVLRDGFPWMMDNLGLANLLRPDLQRRCQPEDRVHETYREALRQVPVLESESAQDSQMRAVSHLALTHFLPVLLDRKDRTSMAAGVEVRVPFCDHRLVEYVWNVPWRVKVGDPGSPTPKALLRSAARGLLPDDVVSRRKAMFPVVADPGYDRLIDAEVTRIMQGDALGALLDRERVTDLLEGRSRRPRWMQRMALGYLVQMQRWMTIYDVEVLA